MSKPANESLGRDEMNTSRDSSKKNIHFEDRLRPWSRWQRFQIWAIAEVGYWLMALIGLTLRYEVRGAENLEAIHRSGHRAIFTFWHNRLFAGTWYFRHRGITVMTSQNFDGEYTTRLVGKLGYGVVRGSSSRGGLKALAKMAKSLKDGRDAAFTIDGPRGPRYQAKMGPVILARKTGQAIFCFHLSYERKWVFLKTWDQFQIPKPFSRILIIESPGIYVDPQSNETQIYEKHAAMQQLLDHIREEGDANWG